MIRVIICLVLVFQASVAQQSKKQWSATKKLQWADFKGEPDSLSPFSANTYSGLAYKYAIRREIKKQIVTCEVNGYFIPEKSWVKKGFENDAELLAHEQLHFDITELFVRKFRQRLKNTRFSRNPKKQIEVIYKKITAERVAMQKQYDLETNHSENKKMQQKWQYKINMLLNKFQQVASK